MLQLEYTHIVTLKKSFKIFKHIYIGLKLSIYCTEQTTKTRPFDPDELLFVIRFVVCLS